MREREKIITRQPPIGEKDDYDSENSRISDGLPSRIRRRRRGEGWGESEERRAVLSKSTLESTAPKARSRSRAGVAMNEALRISPRVSSKSPSSASSSLSRSATKRLRGQQHAHLQRRHSRVHRLPRCQHQSKRRDDEPRDSKRRCRGNTMLDFAPASRYHNPMAEGQKQSQRNRERRQ